jgi:predicted nucleotidyltransferase
MNLHAAVALIRQAVPDAIALYVFGSHARGDAHAASDLDLALLQPRALDSVARFELQERIAAALSTDVDLVDLRSASAVMRVQVIEHGRVLFERDAAEREEFEALALSAYARLNEERRGILEDVRRSGRALG